MLSLWWTHETMEKNTSWNKTHKQNGTRYLRHNPLHILLEFNHSRKDQNCCYYHWLLYLIVAMAHIFTGLQAARACVHASKCVCAFACVCARSQTWVSVQINNLHALEKWSKCQEISLKTKKFVFFLLFRFCFFLKKLNSGQTDNFFLSTLKKTSTNLIIFVHYIHDWLKMNFLYCIFLYIPANPTFLTATGDKWCHTNCLNLFAQRVNILTYQNAGRQLEFSGPQKCINE